MRTTQGGQARNLVRHSLYQRREPLLLHRLATLSTRWMPRRGPPDGRQLALGIKHDDIQVWNTRSKTPLLTAAQRFGEVYALAWSLPGLWLLGWHGAGVGPDDRTDAADLPGAYGWRLGPLLVPAG
jgi:hypothetical protein